MPSSLNGTGVTFNDGTTLQTGSVPAANLGTGTANSTTFLRGDKTWQPAPTPSNATILGAYAGATFNNVGTYAYVWSQPDGGTISLGGTTAGSNLTFVRVNGYADLRPLSGTWRNMGPWNPSGFYGSSSIWLRIS